MFYTSSSHPVTVFTSRCLVAVSNGGRSLSSGFSNSPRPRLLVSATLNWLPTDSDSARTYYDPQAETTSHQPSGFLAAFSGHVCNGQSVGRMDKVLQAFASTFVPGFSFLQIHNSRHGRRRAHLLRQLFYCCVRVCCFNCLAIGVFVEPFLSNSSLLASHIWLSADMPHYYRNIWCNN
jgi:hypothetical protein